MIERDGEGTTPRASHRAGLAELGVAARILRPLVAYLAIQGTDVAALRARHRLGPGDPLGPGVRIPRERFFAIWEDAVATTGDPDLGLRVAELGGRLVGTATPAEDHLATLLLTAAPSVHEGLLHLGRAQRVATPGIGHELVTGADGRRRLRLRPTEEVRHAPRAVIDMLLLWPLLSLGWLAGKPVEPTAVSFPYAAPERASTHHRLLGDRVEFGAPEAAWSLSAEHWSLPLTRSDPARFAALVQQSAEAESLDPMARIRVVLSEALDPTLTAETAARRLGMAPRTLRRTLLKEGTSYRQLLDELRQRRAAQLSREGRTLAEVATALGYSDERALRRAMKRWGPA